MRRNQITLKRKCLAGLSETMKMQPEAMILFSTMKLPTSVLNVKPVPPVYSADSPEVPGRQILKGKLR